VQAGSADAKAGLGRNAAATPDAEVPPSPNDTVPSHDGAPDGAGVSGNIGELSDDGGVNRAVAGPVDDFLPHAAAPAGSPGRRARRAPRPPRAARARWGRGRRGRDEPGPEWLPDDPWRPGDQELSWLAPDDPASDAPANPRSPEPQAVAPASHADGLDAAGPQLTAAGLPQRPRSVARHEPAPAPAASDQSDSAPPANRAPEQVLDLLARFEAGRRRAASDAHVDSDGTDATDARVTQGPEDR
jgi:hypothetical protein